MALQKDTVAIPLVSGIKPATRARLLDPQKLLVAQNCTYILEQGPQKRNGHTSKRVRTASPYIGMGGILAPEAAPGRDTFSIDDPQLSASWLYGWGIYDASQVATTTDPFEVSPQPDAGQLFGATIRDSEVVGWDGHRLFGLAPNQSTKFGEAQSGSAATIARGPATMPMLRAQTLAKIADAQLGPDAADNGVLRVAGWINSNLTTVSYSAFDSDNRACLVFNRTFTMQAPKSLRVISVGPWFHILVSDPTANLLEMRSFHQDTPDSVVSRNLGPVDNQFDVKKIDETKFVVVKSKANAVTAFVLNADGSTVNTFIPALGGFAASANLAIACEVDKAGNVGIAWQTTGAPITVNFATYNQGGAVITARQAVATISTARRMTVAPRIVSISPAAPIWDVYLEDLIAGLAQVRTYAVQAGSSSTLLTTRHRVVLASHAVRVGNRTFAWAANWLGGSIGFQNTWFLLDCSLQPVGKLAFGQANPDLGGTLNTLASLNWSTTATYKDRVVYRGALGFNVRVPTFTTELSPTPNGVFTEPSIMFYELDFLPNLVAAQAGRAAYFAGAQLWAYDGAECVEAGFHMAPEGVTGVASAGGALSAGVYAYRVDLCHKNSQGEEVRSWSIISPGITAALNDKITLTIPVVPVTRREDSYFLIFRTAANGTVFTLTNSRNPTSALFLRNNQANATFTYVDTLSDAAIAGAEQHPAGAGGNFVFQLPAPACEIVAAGRDRLWLAGGELNSGEVAPSRLFQPGETPSFNPALHIQVDRNAEPITGIGFMGEVGAVFRRTSTYIIDSDGPDNVLQGQFASPRLAIADTGAVSQSTLALTVLGLWFQSPAGLRLLTNSGVMDPAGGMDVDPITTGTRYSAAVVVPQYTQVRWYARDSSDPTVVLDYSSNSWSLWTGVHCSGAVFWPLSNLAVLSRGTGDIWQEAEGVYNDGGSPFEMKVQMAWLHAGQLGDFQRVRRVALFGAATAPVTIRVRYFYDERPFYDEEVFVEFPEADGANITTLFNASLWGGQMGGGGAGWGEGGAWGDDDNLLSPAQLTFRDGVFKFRLRPGRQKCSVFSVEFSDQAVDGPGFVPVVLGLELGVKPGLDRIPTP